MIQHHHNGLLIVITVLYVQMYVLQATTQHTQTLWSNNNNVSTIQSKDSTSTTTPHSNRRPRQIEKYLLFSRLSLSVFCAVFICIGHGLMIYPNRKLTSSLYLVCVTCVCEHNTYGDRFDRFKNGNQVRRVNEQPTACDDDKT